MAILVQSNKKPSVSFPEQTGSIVTFNSQNAGLPLKSCKVNIPVTQEGTGDPSPTNVRNFVEVDSLDFSATSKNLLRPNTGSGTYNGVTFTFNEDFSVTTSGEYQGTPTPFIFSYLVSLRAGTYILTGCPAGGSYSDYVLRIENRRAERIALDTGNGATFTLTEDQSVFCRIYIYSQNGIGKTFYPMVRLADSGSAYQPFGDNKLFSFGQTIYAGQLDVLTGVLTVTHKLVDMGSLLWQYSNAYGNNLFYTNSISDMAEIAMLASSQYKYAGVITSSGDFSSIVDKTIVKWRGASRVYLVDSNYTDVSSFTLMLTDNNAQLVYELATPEVINLGGMEIELLQGENNLFASTGDTTVQYIKIGG